MKRWTQLLLVGVFAAGILAGCSGEDPATANEGAGGAPKTTNKPVREGQQAQQAKPEEPL
jgi:hypothetical protein